MQATILFVVTLLMLTPSLAVPPPLGESVQMTNQGLIDGPIADLDLKASNIHLMLSRLSARTKIPIGLEVSPYDDLMIDRDMKLEIQKGTLRTALDSIVKQIPFTRGRYKMG